MMDSTMYNYDRKAAFMEFYINGGRNKDAARYRQRDAVTALNKVAIVEAKYKKDFCEFKSGSTEMNDLCVLWLNNLADTRRVRMTSILRAYLKWCYQNDYINAEQYYGHDMTSTVSRSSNKTDVWSSMLIKQMEVASENETNSLDSDFIFEDKESFIEYVSTVLGHEKYTMPAALMVLLYYQFESTAITKILKSEVDTAEHTVQNVYIDDEVAFGIIYRAKIIDSYSTTFERNNKNYDRIEYYADSPYLLRNTSRGRKKEQETDQQVPYSFVKKVMEVERKANKELPENSPYKNVIIKGATISKLKLFHEMRVDEKKYGLEFVKENIIDGKYGNYTVPQTVYREYCLMASKARKI